MARADPDADQLGDRGDDVKLLLVHNSYQQPGGEDQVFTSERELLLAHGHDVVCHTAHNDEVRALGNLRLALRTTWSHSTYRALRAAIARERPQIVHVHNTLPLLSPAVYYAARAMGVPVVQTLHNYRLLCPKAVMLRKDRVCEDCLARLFPWPGVIHACYRDSHPATAAVAMMLGVHRLLGTWTRMVTRYVALTEFMRRKFVDGGLPPNGITVKPNFVARDPGVGGHGGGYALFVGRLSPEKGLRTLLQGWGRVGPRLPLKIAGAGPLETLAASSAPNVEWLGAVPHAGVLELMKRASFLVVPSESYEGFPTTVAEAFATGLPVLASRLGAATEIVHEHRTGLFFPPGDASGLAETVTWALDHPARVAEMRQHARAEFQARYTAKRNYQLLMDIYHMAMNAADDPGGRPGRDPNTAEVRDRPGHPPVHAGPPSPALPAAFASEGAGQRASRPR